MHYLLIVTLTMPLTATSEDVRDEVEFQLNDDPTFCGEGGRFSIPICDRFVIGGRWSGYLSEVAFGDPYKQALQNECSEFARDSYTSQDVERNRDKLDELWSRFGGKGDSPYARESQETCGYEDDAEQVDRTIYDALLKQYVGESKYGDVEFIDLDGDAVDESFIGGKWVVVVDYHN